MQRPDTPGQATKPAATIAPLSEGAQALLALIDTSNQELVTRWAAALHRTGGMYATIDESGLTATARGTIAIFQASLGAGAMPSDSARRYADPPPYRKQPLDEFVLAGMLVDREVRDYLTEQGADPDATAEATARFSQLLVTAVLNVVRLRQARIDAGQLLSEVGRTLAGVGTASQRLDRAASRIAAEFGLGPCVILGRAHGLLRVVGCDTRTYGQRSSLSDRSYDAAGHPWVDEVLAGQLREVQVDPARSVFERRVSMARYSVMYARALTVNDEAMGLLLVFSDGRRTLEERFDPHLDALATLLAPHVALSDSAGALQKAESAIDELFEASPNLMCTLDRLGRIERTNSAFRLRIGVPDDVIGMPLSWLVHPAWMERFTEQWTRAIDDPVKVNGERIDLINARSERIPLAFEARWLRDGSETPTHCLIALSDIARYVEQAEADAHQIDELNAFAHHIAHDLRGPLRSIAGFAGLLDEALTEGVPADEARTYTTRIEGAVDRADTLITGLLRFAQTAHVDPLVDEVSPSALLQDALEGIGGALELRRISVRLSAAERHLLGDRTALSTLLMNLIDNGARYTPEGGQVEVAVRAGEPGWAALEVRDHGPGIDPADQARIFRLFERGDDPASRTGVGLAIVRRIARAHGGRVAVESTLGEGALFRVTLPTA